MRWVLIRAASARRCGRGGFLGWLWGRRGSYTSLPVYIRAALRRPFLGGRLDVLYIIDDRGVNLWEAQLDWVLAIIRNAAGMQRHGGKYPCRQKAWLGEPVVDQQTDDKKGWHQLADAEFINPLGCYGLGCELAHKERA